MPLPVLRERLRSGLLLTAGLIGLIVLDGYLSTLAPARESRPLGHVRHWLCNGLICTLLTLVTTWLVAGELARFAKALGFRPFDLLAKLFAAGLVIGPYISVNVQALADYRDESWAILSLAIALGCGFFMQAVWRRTEDAMVNLATTVFIVFYAGGLAGFIVRLRLEVGGAGGAALLLFTLLCIKMADIGAYFVGSLAGRNKLIEWLSPKKTWEGFVGGLAFSVVWSLGIGAYLERAGFVELGGGWRSFALLGVFGLVMGVTSVAGDLCASLLKRNAAVKDSGQVIPGMGGALDVADSPLLAAPVAWFFWTRLVPLLT
ncbi:MAG: phosphatidate cytidylyltransferase [Phycisphaerae bacterium]